MTETVRFRKDHCYESDDQTCVYRCVRRSETYAEFLMVRDHGRDVSKLGKRFKAAIRSNDIQEFVMPFRSNSNGADLSALREWTQ